MIGRWIRLIEAERALAGERFAEALDLAGHESVRGHRRAETVRRKAAEALLARAREQLGRGDLSGAFRDLRLADRSGEAKREAERLEREIAPLLEEREARRRLVEEMREAAERAEKEGDALRARALLRGLPDPPPPVKEALARLEAALGAAEAAAQEAARACEAGDPRGAEGALERLRRLVPRHPLLPGLERALEVARALPALRAEADRAAGGAASRAFAFLSRHVGLHPDLAKTSEAEAILRRVREARRARILERIEAGELRSAAAEARRLAATGPTPEDRGLLEGTLLAARGAKAAARGEARLARDAFERAARGHPAVAAACAAGTGRADPGPEPSPALARILEAEIDARRRPWDGAALEAAGRVADAEERRAGEDAGARAAAARIRSLRPVAHRHRSFREALGRALFAPAARELAAAVEHLRRLGELEAAEDLRLEGVALLLETMEARAREGKTAGIAEAARDSASEELAAGLFEDRLVGLADAVLPAGATPAEAPPGRDRASFPRRFVLRMDGGGDALVFAGDALRIGHARERSNDLPILARVAAFHAEIRRKLSFHEGVLYELLPAAGRAVARNGEPQRGAFVLREGDRVTLGEAFGFEFRLPTPRSRSAVLLLDPACEVGGASAVVLLKPGADGRILVGGGADAHLGPGRSRARAEIFLDDRGGLLARGEQPLLVEGVPTDGEARLGGGEEIAVGDLRFFVARD